MRSLVLAVLAFAGLLAGCATSAPASTPPTVVLVTPTAAPPASPAQPAVTAPAPGPALASPSSSPSPAVRISQAVQSGAVVPAGWAGITASTADGAELGVYLPRRTFHTGEEADALVVLRNSGGDLLEPRACNGEIYFELVLRDPVGRDVYSWTQEHFPRRPGQGTLPRCT